MTQPINPGSSKALTGAQVEMLMRQAGFPDSELKTGVGVAFAESSNVPTAHVRDSDDDSYGLFQINMIGALGPDRRRRFNLKNNQQLLDPAINTQVAYKIWKENGWKAWTTYTSGKYKDGIIPRTEQGVENVTEGVKDAASAPFVAVSRSFDVFGKNVMKTGATFGAIVVAVCLLIAGVIILTGQSKKVQDLAGKAVKARTGGMVGK